MSVAFLVAFVVSESNGVYTQVPAGEEENLKLSSNCISYGGFCIDRGHSLTDKVDECVRNLKLMNSINPEHLVIFEFNRDPVTGEYDFKFRIIREIGTVMSGDYIQILIDLWDTIEKIRMSKHNCDNPDYMDCVEQLKDQLTKKNENLPNRIEFILEEVPSLASKILNHPDVRELTPEELEELEQEGNLNECVIC